MYTKCYHKRLTSIQNEVSNSLFNKSRFISYPLAYKLLNFWNINTCIIWWNYTPILCNLIQISGYKRYRIFVTVTLAYVCLLMTSLLFSFLFISVGSWENSTIYLLVPLPGDSAAPETPSWPSQIFQYISTRVALS